MTTTSTSTSGTITTTGTSTFTTTSSSSSTPTGGPNQQNNNGSIATSASLYLYTFLATLVLLLSVSAAIVIRSFVLRRRHRLMVEEAIRNGTWVPPAPPSRPARVDLSKKPVLWEAYIDDKGSLQELYASASTHDHWRAEQSKDWDTIKPFSVAYVPKASETLSAAVAHSNVSLPLNTVTATDAPANDALATQGATGGTSSALSSGLLPVPATAPTPAPTPRTPIHRTLLSRAMRMLNPTPDQTSPLPSPVTAGGSTADLSAQRGGADIAMAELHHNSTTPSVMRVAVLIAMPSASNGSLSNSSSSISALTGSSSAHPLQTSAASSAPVTTDEDEHSLPYLEMGVAEVLMVPQDLSGSFSREKVRDSVGSQESRDFSEGHV